MASREAQIARQLSGLSFVTAPAVREEIRQSIMDYFIDDGEVSGGELSDVEIDDNEEMESETVPVASTSRTQTPDSVCLLDELVERPVLAVGVYSSAGPGDEGILKFIADFVLCLLNFVHLWYFSILIEFVGILLKIGIESVNKML